MENNDNRREISNNIAQGMLGNLNWNVMMDHIKFIELGIRDLYKTIEFDDYKRALRMRSKRNPSGGFIHLTERIEEAILKAMYVHEGQLRKGNTRITFVCHPLNVAEILGKYTKNEDVIIAGLLHDTIEDGGNKYSYDRIRDDFGERVEKIVSEVTEDMELKNNPDRVGTWKERKEKYLQNLEKNASQEGLLVSCADKLHNLHSLDDFYQGSDKGEKFWDNFNSSKEEIFWYNKKALNIFSHKLKCHGILKELEQAYNNLIAIQK